MRKVKYSISILAFLMVMSLAYYASYRTTVNRYNQQKQELASTEQEVKFVDTTKDEIITSDTIYILETYDVNTNNLVEEIVQVPVEFLGLTREKLIAKLQQYDESPLTEDVEKGFVNFALVSFSKDTIVLRKTYEIVYEYFLKDDRGMVVVYEKDKKTVYEYTNIKLSGLPERLQSEIQMGKFMRDDAELYSFLENYTS